MRGKGNQQSKKEKTLMLVSSALVLTALTVAGIYMQEDTRKNAGDEYRLDLEKLSGTVPEKNDQIAKRQEPEAEETLPSIEDDLDYMPMEVNSDQVSIGDIPRESVTKPGIGKTQPPESEVTQPEVSIEPLQEIASEAEPVTQTQPTIRELSFSEIQGLIRPLNGNVLIPYSMDSSVYFATLDQYRYNPAMILGAAEDTEVFACAEGKVKSVFSDAEIGNAITMELGNGYELTYGQLKEISVLPGEYVDAGQMIAKVAAPTKYYLLEGSNLYLQCKKDGEPVDPSELFRE